MIVVTFGLYLVAFLLISFGFNGLFKKSALIYSIPFGFSLFVVSVYLKAENLYLFLALLSFVHFFPKKVKQEGFSLLNKLSSIYWHLMAAIYISTISYYKLVQFWQWGPPGGNQDTIWNIGHIAYFKFNLPFINQFSDIHILGNNFNYHFFGHFIFAKLAQVFDFSAISAGTMSNLICLLASYYLVASILKNKYTLSHLATALLSLAPFIFLGLFGLINPYFDILGNTTGSYYYQVNLMVPLSIFFTIAAFHIYLEILYNVQSNQPFNYAYYLSFTTCVLFSMFSKGPYAAITIATCGSYSMYFWLKHFRDQQIKSYRPFILCLFTLLIFVLIYFKHFSFVSQNEMTIGFHNPLQTILASLRPPLNIDNWIAHLALPFYLIAFFGIGFIVNFNNILNSKENEKTQTYSLIGLISFFWGALALIFLNHRGGSQIYFACAAIVINNLMAVFTLAYQLESQKISETKKRVLILFFLCAVGSYFKGVITPLLIVSYILLLLIENELNNHRRVLFFKVAAIILIFLSITVAIFENQISTYYTIVEQFLIADFKFVDIYFWGLFIYNVFLLFKLLSSTSGRYLKISYCVLISSLLLFLFSFSTSSYTAIFHHKRLDFIFFGFFLAFIFSASEIFKGALFKTKKFWLPALVLFFIAVKIPQVAPSVAEINLRKACYWINQNSQWGQLIAVNIFDDEKAGPKHFFSCSAVAERQIFIEGYHYIFPSVENLNLVDARLAENNRIFNDLDFTNVDFILDTKMQIKNLQPAIDYSGPNQSIRIFTK